MNMLLINVFICLAGICICACRGGKITNTKTRLKVRMQYWLTGVSFFGLMFSPPEAPIIAIASVLLILLLITLPRWKNGAPRESYKRHFVNSPHTDHVISMQRRG